jgi:epsilon-lactone hydrolase
MAIRHKAGAVSSQPLSPPRAGLPPERSGYAAPADLAARRANLATAVASGLWKTDAEPVEEMLGGVRCLRFAPPIGIASRATVLHLHGGAFRLGCPEQLGPFAAALAVRAGVDVVCPAYRLAPEHPFPAGLNDARAVLRALAGHRPIFLSGDSAGGGLAAGLAALARHDDRPPIGLILLSAWLDLSVSSASYEINAQTDPLFSRLSAAEAADLYLQGTPADHPSASPLRGELGGFPPTLISVGMGEVLLDDAQGFHARLLEAGASAKLDIVAGMEHVAVTRGFDLEGAARTFDATVDFISERLD